MHANSPVLVLRSMGKTRIATLAALGGLILTIGLITSCSNAPNSSNRQLEEKSAQVTERAKQESKQALADARTAASNAEGKVNAIASGVKQGIRAKNDAATPGPRVDLNTASEDDLAALPGISRAKARQIIRRRPYDSARQLVARGLLSQSEFERIAEDVTVR